MSAPEGILACIPVRAEDVATLRVLYDQLPPPRPRFPTRYADSIEGTCTLCQRPVWIGPQGQELLKQPGRTPVVCFICVIAAMAEGILPKGVQHLGNREFG